MCGITGVFDLKSHAESLQSQVNINRATLQRGTDNVKIFFIKKKKSDLLIFFI